MGTNSIFYYPYGSFTDTQAPLLKAAALYFDKLYILDPEKASGGVIGVEDVANDVALLEQEGILERVAPEDVLHRFEAAIAEAVQTDLQDPEFTAICEASGKAAQWTLALAKIPEQIRSDPQFQPLDRSMQRLMGDVARNLSPDTARYSETYAEFAQFNEVYREHRMGADREIEYRYAVYPLPLGESIMVNHALFGGLLYSGATPLTDDPFHNSILSFKIDRAKKNPEVARILEDRARQRQLRHDLLSVEALTDTQLNIPAISAQLPLEEILEYRNKHGAELEQAREELGWLARTIEETPWSEEFASEVEHQVIPRIREKLVESTNARDSWLKSQRGSVALKAAGLAAGAAAVTLSLVISATPLLPVAVVTTILGLVGGQALPGLELALEWREGKRSTAENGLHYFLGLKGGRT